MNANTPVDAYPLSTQDHRPIPLDAVRPVRLLSGTADSVFALAANEHLMLVESSGAPCVIVFEDKAFSTDLTEAMYIPQAGYVAWGTQAAIAIPYKAARVLKILQLPDLPAPAVRIQLIQLWADIRPSAQFARQY